MKTLMVTMLAVVITASIIPLHTYGQDSAEVVIFSPKVGEVIDASERDHYGLFQKAENFSSAVIMRLPDGKFIARITVVTSSGQYTTSMEMPEALIYQYAEKIEHFNELKAGTYVMGTNRSPIIINGKNVIWHPKPQTSQIDHSGRNDERKNSMLNTFETNDTSQAFLLSGGIGGSSEGISVGGNISLRINYTLISLRCVYNAELNIFGFGSSESALDFGVLYGICYGGSYGFASLQGGISVARITSLRNLMNPSITIGIPVSAQLFLTAGPNYGVGICAFADWNREKSFYGALLCFQIGSVNYRSIDL